MDPWYSHAGVELYLGDCRSVLEEVADESVQCCVTSPPYFGLRDYSTATWEGGDPECGHLRPPETMGGMNGKQPTNAGSRTAQWRGTCRDCGAVRIDRQIGLEASVMEYVDALVGVFREVRRTVRRDGTLWLNLGDSYAGAGYSNHTGTGGAQREDGGKQRHTRANPGLSKISERGGSRDGLKAVAGFKPKDLLGVPWRVAFALQADGWWLRSDIVWAKPAPMPTKSHEYVFLLSRSERYLYQADAIAEPCTDAESLHGYRRAVATDALEASDDRGYDGHRTRMGLKRLKTSGTAYTTRNKRSVWTVNSDAFPGAHFAVMPQKLVEPCILAGSRPGDLVLDPFGGAGTVAVVAKRLERRCTLVELNPAYAEIAAKRLRQDVLPLELPA